MQLAEVVPGAGVQPLGAALVALGPAEGLGRGVQQGVEGLLHGVAGHLIEVATALVFIAANQVPEGLRGRRRGVVGQGRLLVSLGSVQTTIVPARADSATPKVRNYLDVIPGPQNARSVQTPVVSFQY